MNSVAETVSDVLNKVHLVDNETTDRPWIPIEARDNLWTRECWSEELIHIPNASV